MKINLKQHILDYEGKPIMVDKVGPDGLVVLGENLHPVKEAEILRNYLVSAINNQAQDESVPFSPEVKSKVYILSMKLYPKKGNEADLTLDDRSFLKERVSKIYGPLVSGRINDILEEKERVEPLDESK